MSERSRHGGVDRIPLPLDRGALWLCGKHFVGPDAEAAMQQVGATTVVCLNQRAELESRYPLYVEWLQNQTPQRVVWFPIPDLGAPAIEAATALLGDLHSRIARGDTLLVHCGAGIGRAGTMAAALLMAMGFERERAVAHVGAHRAMAGPEAGAQRELLEALEALARTMPQPQR